MKTSRVKQKSSNSSIQIKYRISKSKKSVYQEVKHEKGYDKLFNKLFPKVKKIKIHSPVKTTRNSVYSTKKLSVHISPQINSPESHSYFKSHSRSHDKKDKSKIIKKKHTIDTKNKQKQIELKQKGISQMCLLKLKQLDKRSREIHKVDNKSKRKHKPHTKQSHTEITQFMSQKNLQQLRNSFTNIFKPKKQKKHELVIKRIKDSEYFKFS